jgi:CRISPR/Cas system CSM-associated protein Csm5 (group 7 of RAMP superfamily)
LQGFNKNLKEEQEFNYNKSLLKGLKNRKESPRSFNIKLIKCTPFKSFIPRLIKGAIREVLYFTYNKSLKLFLFKRVTN